MRPFGATLSALGLAASALACGGDDHGHSHELRRRGEPSVPVTPPTVPLVWGDLNIIHTTDSHGWLLGHTKASFPEPNYSGDLGDFASFVKNMKHMAAEKDVDLLLIDTGDLHDGTGLTDGFPAGSVDAHAANKFVAELPYDVMAIGNHELYIYANTYDMYKNFAPKFPGRYLSSNVNITVYDKHNQSVSVPVGSRYAKFHTQKGKKVTALGVLYNFTGNDKNTTVQSVQNMVKEQWFNEAIADAPDLFLLTGHMPVRYDNWPVVYNAIRAVHPTTPIIVLGGHTHIRDCLQYDGRSMALESGRYMETLGWMSMNFDKPGATPGNLTFSRRYLDPNRVTYEFHTSKTEKNFDTWFGEQITKGLQALVKSYNLSSVFGTAPQDYYLSRVPYPNNASLLSLFVDQAAPIALAVNNTRANIPNVIIANSGSQRFDLYAGPFTRDEQFEVSPFTDAFLYIPAVPAGVAQQLLPLLNKAGANKREVEAREAEEYAKGSVDKRYNEWLRRQDEDRGAEKRAAANLTLGYVTKDSCPGVGDDTLHAPLPYYSTPGYIQSTFPNVTATTPIDLVFVDFIESDVITFLNKVQTATVYASSMVQSYSPFLANQVLGVFAQQAWK